LGVKNPSATEWRVRSRGVRLGECPFYEKNKSIKFLTWSGDSSACRTLSVLDPRIWLSVWV
jgi:hypothetical protein